MIANLVRAEAGDERQPARLVLRIQRIDQLEQAVRLSEDRISGRAGFDAATEFDMRMVGLSRAVADPYHMAGCRVPVARRQIDTRQRLLVAEQQRLVAGVKIGLAQREIRVRRDATARMNSMVSVMRLASASYFSPCGLSATNPSSICGRSRAKRSRPAQTRGEGSASPRIGDKPSPVVPDQAPATWRQSRCR
jgi:hypothetical protein